MTNVIAEKDMTTHAKPMIDGMTEEGEKLNSANVDIEHAAKDNPAARLIGNSKEAVKLMNSRAERVQSFDVADFPLPKGREEEWRFSPLKKLAPLFEDAATDVQDGQEAVDYSVSENIDGVSVSTLAIGEAPRGTVLVPADRPAVVASKNVENALHVKIAADAELIEPVIITATGQGAGRRGNAHYVIEVGNHASAVVVLDHRGSANLTENVEIIVGDGANVRVVTLQQWDDTAKHAGQTDAIVGRDATYRHVAVSLGGEVVRLNSNVRFAAEGAEAELFGLYFADAHQHLEHRSFVDHNAPRNTSNVLYKGALQGAGARTVWVGDVLIQKQAEGTSSYEANRNLVLTDGARADSVPNLEIETGLIEGAGHASTTGRFDDEHLFYFMARGIDEKTARLLVVRGFLNEIVQQIGVASIEEEIIASLDKELEATDAVAAAAAAKA